MELFDADGTIRSLLGLNIKSISINLKEPINLPTGSFRPYFKVLLIKSICFFSQNYSLLQICVSLTL